MSDYNIKSIKEDFKNKGIFYTPKELALYMKSFFDGEDIKEIYDPTCGDGGLLEVFDDNIIKYGQDINQSQIENAKNKLTNFHGECADTLKEPKFTEKKFDYIIANPPFSIKWEQNKDKRFDIAPVYPPKSKADYAFILHILSCLSEKGKAVIMEFPGILYRGNSEGKIRKWLIDQNLIEKIISIPENKFIDTKIATCIIIINKQKKNNKIEFIDDNIKKSRIVDIQEIKNNDYVLSVNLYVEEDKTQELINPKSLQTQARNGFLNKLKKELNFDLQVCKMEGWNFEEYINQIENVINEFKRR